MSGYAPPPTTHLSVNSGRKLISKEGKRRKAKEEEKVEIAKTTGGHTGARHNSIRRQRHWHALAWKIADVINLEWQRNDSNKCISFCSLRAPVVSCHSFIQSCSSVLSYILPRPSPRPSIGGNCCTFHPFQSACFGNLLVS